MILVDTAVWIDHLHRHDPLLAELLGSNQVAVHPHVILELALGTLRNRDDVLAHLRRLPRTASASPDEILAFVEARSLAGRGLSAVDVHLLASALVTSDTRLWTRDRRLHDAAVACGVAWRSDEGASSG